MSGCHGFCEMGPLVHIEPMGIMYIHVKPEDCHEIIERPVLGGEVIDRLTYHLDGVAYPRQEYIPFYKKQQRVVLENCGTSDAEDIEEYIAKGGYAGFERALFEMTDEEVWQETITSGLRGRGGGGGGTIDKESNIIRRIQGKLIVPRYFFMACLLKNSMGYRAIAFWAEQKDEWKTYDDLADYAITIDELERKTGIDFFCNLQDKTENEVEKKIVLNVWGL